MKFDVVDRKSAPRPATKSRVADRMSEYDRVVKTLVTMTRKTVVIDPDGDDERSVRLRLQRAALRASVKIKTWHMDGKVYAELASAAPSASRRKAR